MSKKVCVQTKMKLHPSNSSVKGIFVVFRMLPFSLIGFFNISTLTRNGAVDIILLFNIHKMVPIARTKSCVIYERYKNKPKI